MNYRRPVGYEKGSYITSSQIVSRFGNSIKLNNIQVGKALKELGFQCIHTKRSNIWVVVERTVDEIKSILPETETTDDTAKEEE